MARARWTPETPWVKSRKKTEAYWPPYVCRNPHCKSFGKSHPNCECGAPTPDRSHTVPGPSLSHASGPAQAPESVTSQYAEGGEVHFCEGMNPHASHCEHFAEGGEVKANREFSANPSLALDHAIVDHGLLHALTRTGHSKSENPNKPSEDFLEHAHRGRKSVKSHLEHHFDPKHEHPEVGKDEISALKNHLDAIRQNPAQILETGSLPGLPEHSAALGAKAAAASDYFDSIKPKQSLPGPLDPVMPTDKLAEQAYHRQLGIAEKPLSILAKVRAGTVVPADLQTLNALYPQLAKSIQDKAFDALVDTKTREAPIPYRHKMGLSFLLGQPLDATMTPAAMQSIMKANAGAQTESQGMPNKPKHGATAATQKTIAKTDDLYKTQLEKIQTEK